jgi:hypothetical protein
MFVFIYVHRTQPGTHTPSMIRYNCVIDCLSQPAETLPDGMYPRSGDFNSDCYFSGLPWYTKENILIIAILNIHVTT